jgi:catechol 2,3-dioxygenase-like lactoylglutathione lyase family enzyme
MTTRGFDHLYVETHDWVAALAFWEALGFHLEFETDHHSGMLRNPGGGPTLFLAEQSLEDPLATEMYLAADADFEPSANVTVVSPFKDTHWGTKVMIIQDADGHRFRVEAPAGE